MNRYIKLAFATLTLAYMTSSNTMAQNAADAAKILSATPAAGTHLARGAPVNIEVDVQYTLTSLDTAWLNISIGELPATPPNCKATTGGNLSDAAGVAITKGTHEVKVQLTWSGDTGKATKGKVYNTGYISFYPMFYTASHGQRVKSFGMAPDYCYPFGP